MVAIHAEERCLTKERRSFTLIPGKERASCVSVARLPYHVILQKSCRAKSTIIATNTLEPGARVGH